MTKYIKCMILSEEIWQPPRDAYVLFSRCVAGSIMLRRFMPTMLNRKLTIGKAEDTKWTGEEENTKDEPRSRVLWEKCPRCVRVGFFWMTIGGIPREKATLAESMRRDGEYIRKLTTRSFARSQTERKSPRAKVDLGQSKVSALSESFFESR